MIVLIMVLSAGLCFCSTKKEQPGIKGNSIASFSGDKLNFQTQVEPVFQKNCSPCHFPGGKIYGRMPFDKDTTIIHHEAGILRRIKNAEEVSLIKRFIQENEEEKD